MDITIMEKTNRVQHITPSQPAGTQSVARLFPVCLFRNRVLLRQLTLREVRSRYESSMLGIFWAFFTPLISLLIYSFVFSYVFESRWEHDNAVVTGIFPLIILCGLTAYNIFSESINSSSRTIVLNKNYVKKVIFPLEILPISNLLAALYFGMIWFFIAIIGVGVFQHRICMTLVALPLVLLPLLLFTAGLCWFFASLSVYIRDVPHLVNILMLVMLYMTGIFYSPSILPLSMQKIIYLNPLAVIVEQVRRVLIFDEWPDWRLMGLLSLASLAVAQLGYSWFVRTKKGFADVL
jgi:lipopolysaccharide transport system permease protein